MLPTGRQTYTDPVLSDFATRNFDGQDDQFVADRITGMVSVGKQSGMYSVFDPSGFMNVYDDFRAPRTAPKQVQFSQSTDTFFCHNRALAAEMALEDLANQDRALGLRENSTLAITLGLRRAQEVRIAALATSSGGPGTIVQPPIPWNNVASADILGAVSSAHVGMANKTGMRPNTVVVDWETLMLVSRNEAVLKVFGLANGGFLPDQRVAAEIFKVPNLVVAGGLKNVQPRGVTTLDVQQIWGRICLFTVTNPGDGGLETTNFLQRFRWRNPELPLPYRGTDGRELTFNVVRTQYDGAGQAHVEVIETGYYQGEKITGRDLAYLIKTG